MSEPEAFRWIQKTSMDKRLTMREVAGAVIANAQDKATGAQDKATGAQDKATDSGTPDGSTTSEESVKAQVRD